MNNNDCVAKILNECEGICYDVDHKFSRFSTELLLQKPSKNKWSVAQNIHHLMLANEFYIDQFILLTKIEINPTVKTYRNSKFWSWIINFIRGEKKWRFFLPAPRIVQPFKNDNELDPKELLKNYLAQLELIKSQYQFFIQLDLNKNKVRLPFGPFLYIPLGAAMEFVLAHNTRHFNQINRTLKELDAI